jgi:type IV pilus assembly protein PilF
MKRQWLRAAIVAAILCATGCASSNQQSGGQAPDRAGAAANNLALASDYFRQGNLNLAKEKLERALEFDPRNPQTHMVAGLLYDRLGEYRSADSHFNRAISLDPKNGEIRNSYAVFLCRRNQYNRGEKMALEAAINPLYRTPEAAYMNAGFCARDAQDIKRAEQHFRRALELQPRFAPALFEMSELEFRKQNFLSARAFLERYASIMPLGPNALWLGVRIERSLGNRSTAGDYARRLKNEFAGADETKLLLDSERNAR